jgi:hypothetical protein
MYASKAIKEMIEFYCIYRHWVQHCKNIFSHIIKLNILNCLILTYDDEQRLINEFRFVL